MTKIYESWKWLLGIFTICTFIEATFYGHLTAFTPLYLPRLGIPESNITYLTGIITSISIIPGLLLLPIWGALADRFSRKPIIIRSFVAHLLSAVVCFLSGNLKVFIIGRTIEGLSLGNSGLMMATLSEHTPTNRQSFSIAIMNSAGPIGLFLGPLFGGWFIDRWGFKMLLIIDCFLLLVAIMILRFGYTDELRTENNTKSLLTMVIESINSVFRSPLLQMLFLGLLFLFAGWMLSATYLPIGVIELYKGENNASIIGLILGIGGLVTLIIGPLFGYIADKFGHWVVLITGSLIEMCLWPFLSIIHNLLLFGIIFAFANGVASGVFAVSFSALSSSSKASIRGRVMSLAYLPINLGLMLGPAVGSLVTKSSVFTSFWVASLFVGIGIIFLVVAKTKAVNT